MAADLSSEALEALAEEAEEVIVEAGKDAVVELVTDGLSEEEAQQIIVEVLDGILAWRLFLQEPLASALEAADGPAIAAALEKLLPKLKELKPDPDKIEYRAKRAEERGRPKIAARRRARAERVRARQGAKEG